MNASTRIVALSTLGLLATAHAQTRPNTAASSPATTRAALPTAQQVLDRYVEATGGKDAYAAIRSRRASGTFVIADLGIEGKISVLARADGDAAVSVDLPNVGVIRQGVSGGVAWEVHPISGPRTLSGDAALSARRTLRLFPQLTLDGYRAASVADVVELNGRTAYRMLLTADVADATEIRFYDVESGLLVKTLGQAKGEAGEVGVTTTFSDYEDVPPIRMPMKTQQSMGGMSPESTMTKVEHNVDLADDLFALPPEIVALRRQAATAPATMPAGPKL